METNTMRIQTVRGWKAACDVVADSLLDEAGITAGPVDAFTLARRLGFETILDASQLVRTRFKQLRGRPTIFVRPDREAERQHWAVARAIAERSLGRVVAQLRIPGGKLPGRLKEEICNEMASRLLLPRRWFFPAVEELDGDVMALKRRFATASHELVLLAMLRVPGKSVVSLFDDTRVTRRFSNRAGRNDITALEQSVWQQVHRMGMPCDVEEDGRRVQCWPLHINGHRREFMRVTWPAETDPAAVQSQRELAFA